MKTVVEELDLPSADLDRAWTAIKLHDKVRERLLAQTVLALELRQRFSFEDIPMHGLIVLSGPPGTGKTTLARGLASRAARALRDTVGHFIQIDPHALTSSSLGQSQKEVSKLFHQTIPEHAADRPCIVLLDEVETLAPDRRRMSLESNPIDTHRATDAALAGIDLLTRQHPNILLVATTNFQEAVDRAFLSRADWIEEIGLPCEDARLEIVTDVLDKLTTAWPKVGNLKSHIDQFVRASEGFDGRSLRKTIISAAASSIETASDLNKLTPKHILITLECQRKARSGLEEAS